MNTCDEDVEDYEQEKKIKQWLEENNKEGSREFDYKYINSKGNVRNRFVPVARLDQTLSQDTTATLLDLVTGSDGRDLEYRDNINQYNEIDKYLSCLGFDEEMSEWIIQKMLKFLETKNNLRLERFLTNSEW